MAEILVIHSVLGVHPALVGYAERLRAAGHTVHLPDLWDGAVYESIDEGMAHRDRVGMGVFAERAWAAARELPPGIVYLGYSLGAWAAQLLAQERPGARGAVLMHNLELQEDFDEPWPPGVALQAHIMEGDPWADLDSAGQAIDEIAAIAPAELFVYPGDGHLFTHDGFADFDPDAAALAEQRVGAFLARL